MNRFWLIVLVLAALCLRPATAIAQTDAVTAPANTAAAAAGETAFLFNGESPTSLDQVQLMEARANELAQKLIPSIVNVQVGPSQGSGVVVSQDGYVLTAAHVIGRPNQKATIVFSDGRKVEATTLGLNRGVDSGMLKINESGTWPYSEVGESEGLNLGQWVLAIGHPGGLDEKRGLVLRVGRVLFKNATLLRSDCVLVGGDSGGPLFDFEGRVIGIHSKIGNSLWENFHVPIDTFSDDWDQLVKGKLVGVATSAYIGLNLDGETNKILSVTEGGPAAQAGLQKDDIIIKLDDKEITNRASFGEAFRDLKIGQKIKLGIRRGDQELTLNLEVGEN